MRDPKRFEYRKPVEFIRNLLYLIYFLFFINYFVFSIVICVIPDNNISARMGGGVNLSICLHEDNSKIPIRACMLMKNILHNFVNEHTLC